MKPRIAGGKLILPSFGAEKGIMALGAEEEEEEADENQSSFRTMREDGVNEEEHSGS